MSTLRQDSQSTCKEKKKKKEEEKIFTNLGTRKIRIEKISIIVHKVPTIIIVTTTTTTKIHHTGELKTHTYTHKYTHTHTHTHTHTVFLFYYCILCLQQLGRT